MKPRLALSRRWLALLGASVALAPPTEAVTLLSNDFDPLTTDTGPSFGIVSNNNEDNDTTDASTGLISFNDEGSGTPAIGFSTTSPLDLSGAPGFTLTWEVASATVLDNDGFGGITANGWFFGVQSLQGLEDVGTTLWNNDPASIGITIFNSNSPGNDAVDLVSSVAGTGGTAESNIALLADAPTLDSLNDGFSLTLTINSDDTWTASSTGLSTDFNASGDLGSVGYSDVASNLYAATVLQSTLTSFAVANYESVSLEAIPEPSAVLLNLIAFAGMLLHRRR